VGRRNRLRQCGFEGVETTDRELRSGLDRAAEEPSSEAKQFRFPGAFAGRGARHGTDELQAPCLNRSAVKGGFGHDTAGTPLAPNGINGHTCVAMRYTLPDPGRGDDRARSGGIPP